MISIKHLQELADAVWIGKSKPKIRYNNQSPKARYKIDKLGNIAFDGFQDNADTLTARTFAHAHSHSKRGEESYRQICFSWKGLNRRNNKVIRTLAHELAHLKVPHERHDSKVFKYWCRAFELNLVREIIRG